MISRKCEYKCGFSRYLHQINFFCTLQGLLNLTKSFLWHAHKLSKMVLVSLFFEPSQHHKTYIIKNMSHYVYVYGTCTQCWRRMQFRCHIYNWIGAWFHKQTMFYGETLINKTIGTTTVNQNVWIKVIYLRSDNCSVERTRRGRGYCCKIVVAVSRHGQIGVMRVTVV
jgi:hypothetical protein